MERTESGNLLEADKNGLETENGQDAGRQDDIPQSGGQQDETRQSDEWDLTLRAQDVTAKGCTIVYEQHGGASLGSELPPGTYRIVKEIMNFRGTGDYDENEYYAEFIL